MPKTPLGELTALPQTILAGFKGATSRQEGMEGRGGKDLGRGKRGKEGKGRMGKGGETGGSWGNSALVVGGIDAPDYHAFRLFGPINE